jgi:hypothetical protein
VLEILACYVTGVLSGGHTVLCVTPNQSVEFSVHVERELPVSTQPVRLTVIFTSLFNVASVWSGCSVCVH